MLTRALIVVLAILNVGVALWWMLRGDAAPAPPPAPPTGVAQLQLLDTPKAAAPAGAPAEAPDAAGAALTDATPAATNGSEKPASEVAPGSARPPEPRATSPAQTAASALTAAPAAPAPATPSPAPTPAPGPLQCISLGPFADRDTAMAAQSKAGALVQRSRLRETAKPGASSTYRVMMPAAASREEAQATVKRIAAAGISDYYIMAQGEDANAIALGQYRNREGAERRLAALSAAGFNARLVGGSAGTAQWWVDAALADQATPSAARQRSGAAQQRSLECAGLR
ncbi:MULTISPECIES: SPOR domain-containing protein [Stenotrophomonas]|uniref:SPOR domain-containing protein n=1 Tax=Stenotrophomonas aracearum TaxID=3003272 RepID=A0ABY9YFB2_9GAMM|nr:MULTISPECIES: SPOR domain-containing protein [unclassified Stenotrophomonas]WNH49058.1 SPOR domain-containing protein [Stenotrophomonas sp. A5588]